MKSTAMRRIKSYLRCALFIPAGTRINNLGANHFVTERINHRCLSLKQYGNVKVYLPDDIRPGDVISGRIVTDPLGKNSRQIEKNLVNLLNTQLV